MIEFRKAYDLVLRNCGVIGVEEVRTEESAGKVLAETVRSDTDMPPFNRSAMDGYAVKSSDITKVPAELKVISCVRAGVFMRGHLRKGTAAAIMTGAPVPRGADAVVMVEKTSPAKDSRVKVNSPVKKGDNICKKGEDIKKGEAVLDKGKRIGAPEIAVMASVGKKKIKVLKVPRVSVLATGDELVPHSRRLKRGSIRNSNSPMLVSLLRSRALDVKDLGIARDDRKDLKPKIEKGLESDLLILSGGVSMGQYDFVPKVFKKCGVKRVFHKVAIKPGKPMFFGKKGRTLVFGTPGNPVSVLISFLLYIEPAIKRISGDEVFLEHLKGTLCRSFTSKGNRRTYYPVRIGFSGGRYKLMPLKYHGSADISAVTDADGFMAIDKGARHLKKGEEVEFILL